MKNSCYVWFDEDGLQRNAFALFRQVITLDSLPSEAHIHVFADARYRLRINGIVASYGPIRFIPAHPIYDSIDLSSYLQVGNNILTVEVWSPMSSNFQTMPENRAGFIAWGSIGEADLGTPGNWLVQQSDAWDGGAPSFSFAQGPVEILDTQKVAPGIFDDHAYNTDAWKIPVAVMHQNTWGKLQAKTMPDMSLDRSSPMILDFRATLADDEQLIGYRSEANASNQRFDKSAGEFLAYAMWIHSDKVQVVNLGCFWGPHILNGKEVEQTEHPFLGNRYDAALPLQEGWNLLYGELGKCSETWAHLIALPHKANLKFRVKADMNSNEAFLIAPVEKRSEYPEHAYPNDDCELPDFAWQEIPCDNTIGMPAREAAWQQCTETISKNTSPAFPYQLNESQVFVFDMGTEFLGHPIIDITAP
ncbi:MAG: hypothetical protein HRU15_16245, partial [Planctomycetes bacterium]|nr:hypothetical protein [Planctomycetota bacterium]